MEGFGAAVAAVAGLEDPAVVDGRGCAVGGLEMEEMFPVAGGLLFSAEFVCASLFGLYTADSGFSQQHYFF